MRAALEAVVEAVAVVLEAVGLATPASLEARLVRGGHGCRRGVGERLEALSTCVVGHDRSMKLTTYAYAVLMDAVAR